MIDCKLIALDLDGTLLEADGKSVSTENKKALKEASLKGIKIVVATGRGFDSLPSSVKDAELFDYAITSNGAAVYDFRKGLVILRNLLDAAVVRQYVAEADHFLGMPHKVDALNRCLDYEVFVDGRAYAQRDNLEAIKVRLKDPWAVEYVTATRNPVEDIHGFILDHIEEIDGFCYTFYDQEVKKKLFMHLKEKLTGAMVVDSTSRMLEVEAVTCSKWHAIESLCEKLNISPEDTMVFGDGNNDLDMVMHAGLGVAMDNACEALKEASGYVTKKNTEAGVAEALKAL